MCNYFSQAAGAVTALLPFLNFSSASLSTMPTQRQILIINDNSKRHGTLKFSISVTLDCYFNTILHK
jgi:hypothetical protein